MSTLPETVKSLRPIDLSKTSNDQIKEYFINTYAMYETLFMSIKDEESFKIVPDPLRRPILWYLGHTAAVYIHKLKLSNLISENINEWFESFFKTGVDPILSEELDNDVYIQKLPSSQEIWEFRKIVFKIMVEVIEKTKIQLPITDKDPIYSVVMGCEHERIHYETTTLLLRQMPLSSLKKPLQWTYAPYSTEKFPHNEMIEIKEQSANIGKQNNFPTYGWDNEYGKLQIQVKAFKASKFLITNGEYLEFFQTGAYNDKRYWSNEGWEWKQRTNTQQPLFWVQNNTAQGGFKYRAIFDEMEMPLDWPVDTSYHEAKAYCKWKGNNFRLIREGEFNIIRGEHLTPFYGQNNVQADIGGFDFEAGNTNVKYGGSCPVDSQRESPLGFYDCYGNVHEWSEDWFRPLPGFKEHHLYKDFSGGCFDHKHSLLLGGSWASTGLSASSFFRVAFRRHFYQNVGFRVVEEIQDDDQQAMYTDPVYLNRYLHFNFATNEEFFSVKSNTFDLSQYESYPVKIANESLKYFEKVRKEISPELQDIYENTHALDLGCGMGRTAFEIGRKFSKVTGLDYAHGFINVANELKEKGEMTYDYKKTGDINGQSVAKIAPEIDRQRIHFMQGDAMNLPPLFGPFDLIIASNLIDRLYNPMECLVNLCPMLTYNGILIITSPYTWMEAMADKEKWIGGKDGQTTFEALKEVMSTLCFELVDEQTMTLFIKEHERKFEFIMPHMTIWKKKPFSQEFATSVFKQPAKY